MKESHIDLFVDLLVDKVNLLNSKVAELEAKKDFENEAENVHHDLMGEINSLKESLRKTMEENKKLKDKLSSVPVQKSRNGDSNTYKLMVKYAKAKGFKFARLGVMKAFIENPSVESSEPLPSADPSEKVDTVETPPKKEPEKVDFEDHTVCPNNMHNHRGTTIEVGSADCKLCAFCNSINYDEKYVECKMNK